MTKRQYFATEEERYYLSVTDGSSLNAETRQHIRVWRRRTVIFHYSGGTNRCAVDGCNATVEALTLDHTSFNKLELSQQLGNKNAISGDKLVNMLLNNKFPDVAIQVKCMYHNSVNINPKNVAGGKYPSTKYNIARKITLYGIYGYIDDPTGMTWEHSYNDGAIHRKYLHEKYNTKGDVGGTYFNSLLFREFKAGLPNWPGLVVMHANDNHIGGKGRSGKTNYNSFWTEEKYKPFRETLSKDNNEIENSTDT